MEYTITRRLNSAVEDLSADFDVVCCDRDFRRALRELKKSDEGNWHENLHRLNLMLQKCGCEQELDPRWNYYQCEKLVLDLIGQGKVASAEELSRSAMATCVRLYEKYREYPTPTDYMQRLVDRLCLPCDPWHNDSLRLRILKQFIKYGNYLADVGKKKSRYKKKFIQQYAAVGLGVEKVTDAQVLDTLDDGVFALGYVPSAEAIGEALVAMARTAAPDAQGAGLWQLVLSEENGSLPAALTTEEYLAGLEQLCCSETFDRLAEEVVCRYAAEAPQGAAAQEAGSLPVGRIRAAVSRYLSECIPAAVANAQACRSILGPLNRLLPGKDSTGKKQKEPVGAGEVQNRLYHALHSAIGERIKDDIRLLQLSADLASGQFRTNGATKNALYLFAMVFDMSYDCAGMGERMRDVEKSLFTDYYAANILQYLSPAYRRDKTGGNVIPSGCSINYKNYAEMVCLYWLCRDKRLFLTKAQEMLPEDEQLRLAAVGKIRRSEEMIQSLKERQADAAPPPTADRARGATLHMRQRIAGQPGTLASEDILALPEEEFSAFITAHYDRRVRVDGQDISPFQINIQERTALEEYRQIIGELLQSPAATPDGTGPVDLNDSEALQRALKMFRYGLAFDEPHYLSGVKLTGIDEAFRQLLKEANLLVRQWLQEPGQVERTKLLAALYYRFNERYGFDRDPLQGHSFQEHYDLFRQEADPVLQKCNYALVSTKSLLDMLIVFSSYVYINA